MKVKFYACMTLIAPVLLLSSFVFGHSGGLDKSGCHNDKKSAYHCHSKKITSKKIKISKGYNRNSWSHWSDFDNDCINSRHETLISQVDGQIKMSSDGCRVVSGTWNDPFSGMTLLNASDLDVDHIVPLKWASDHGGLNWTLFEKEKFANDPFNLLAVDDALNQSKGAKGPSEWMPPNHSFRCEYVISWKFILDKYSSLKMTSKENRVFDKQLAACDKKGVNDE